MKRTLALTSLAVALAAGTVQAQSGPGSAELFEYAEWHVDNPSYSGNAFDVEAEATFTHAGSGQTINVGMFYDRNDDWRFRFTGTQTGTWNYTTSSADPELNGLSGSINITPNPNAYGFTTYVGNKWARQKGSADHLEAFVPHFRQGFWDPDGFNWSSSEIDSSLDDYIDNEGFNGVHVFVAGNWVNQDAEGWDFENRDPDPRSFDVLEDMITQVHERGGVTHIWYCGDSGRSQSAESAFGTPGAATTGEKRLLEYIGDRLGAVPGWVMGYGYDNWEHVTAAQLDGWGNYLREHMAYDHLLGARDRSGDTDYDFWAGSDFESRGNFNSGAPYKEMANAVATNTGRPHSYDERWFISRLGTEENIRRQLWYANMAGGVSTIMGNDGYFDLDPFDNAEHFNTFFTFWDGRLKADMVPANAITGNTVLDGGSDTGQYALESEDGNLIVIYAEDTDEIELNLSELIGDGDWSLGARIIAVNALAAYQEIDLEGFSLSDQSIDMSAHGGASDWALAVTPIPEPATLSLLALGGLSVLVRRRRRSDAA